MFTIDLFSDTLAQDRMKYFEGKKNIDWIKKADMRVINSEKELRDIVALVLEDVKKGSVVAVDTETTGLRVREDKLVGISVAWRKKLDGQICAFYVPLISEVDTVNIPNYKTLTILKPLLEKKNIYCNFKFDFKFLKGAGIEADLLADIQMMQICKKEGISDEELQIIKRTGLKEKFNSVFGLEMLELEDALGKGIFNFALAPLSMAKVYATTDAYATLMLYEYLLPSVDPEEFIYKVETQLLKVVAEMEFKGIKLDQEMLLEAKKTIESETEGYLVQIYKLAGEKFDAGSPQQLGKILYGKLGLKITDKTEKTGQPKTDNKTLEKIKDSHQIIPLLLKYKEDTKLLNTFLGRLPSEVCADGHIHTTYWTWGAISGRFTSSEPNLQQVPKGKKKESNKGIIRKAFVPDDGFYLLDFDFANIEYRIFASLCKDKGLVEAFYKDVDFHTSTAVSMFGVSLSEVTDDIRAKAKVANFSLLFGAGPKNLAGQLKCTVPEAYGIFDKYFAAMPAVQPWIENKKQETLATNLAISYYGRKRLFYGIQTAESWRQAENLRSAVNHRIQSTSSDILKIAMLRVSQALKDRDDIQMMLSIHDELLFQVKETTSVDEAVGIIKKAMEIKIPDFVPIVADAALGYSWGFMVDYVPGMKVEDIPFKEKLTVTLSEEDLDKKGHGLNQLLALFPGKNSAFLKIGKHTVETGQKINPTKKLVEEIKKLELEVM